MADKLICFRVPPDLRRAIEEAIAPMGIGISEFMRDLAIRAVHAAPGLVGPDAGYLQGRAFAIQLAHATIEHARGLLPETFEEAIARFGLAGPGRGGG